MMVKSTTAIELVHDGEKLGVRQGGDNEDHDF